MKNTVIDLWLDLREKRLWPVALALVIALVAVPIVLLKPAAGAPADGSAKVDPVSLPVVQGDLTKLEGSSPLDVFGRKNPFRTRADRAKTTTMGTVPGAAPGAEAVPPGDPASAGLGSSLDGSSSDLGGSFGSPSAGTSSNGAMAGGGSGGAGGGTTPGGGSTPGGGGGSGGGGGGTTTPRFYTFAADVEFGRRGAERDRTVLPGDSLPDEKNPLLVYLGTDREGKALFLVGEGLAASGEGTCSPSPERCTIVALTPDPASNQHRFVDAEDREYTIVLRRIRRVADRRASEQTASSSRRDKAAARAASRRGPTAKTSRARSSSSKSARRSAKRRAATSPFLFDLRSLVGGRSR